jgi:dTDP-4-dehydrorhamnose 3,5-epimerase
MEHGPLVDPEVPWSGALDDEPPPGVLFHEIDRHVDPRGWLVKLFRASELAAAGGDAGVGEVFVSSSTRGTVRGMHFQTPPHDHAKTVVCLAGAILDVVVDLRTGSPAAGRAARFRLDAMAPHRLHVPAGMAHGFQALADDTVVGYVVTSEHQPDHDTGVRWDSVGVTWPLPPSRLSERDQSLPPLDEFRSPFRFDPAGDPSGG